MTASLHDGERWDADGGLPADSLLSAIVEGADDAIISRRLDGRVLSWNRAAERLFGYRAEEMIGQSIDVLIPEDRMEEEAGIIARLTAGESLTSLQTIRLAKDGRPLHVSLTTSPVRDASGTIVGASKIIRDSGSWHAAQDALARSERRFHMLADNIAQLAWIAEPDGAIHWYNRRWYEYTGTSEEDMASWGWIAVHHPDHVERVTRDFRASIAAGTYWEDTFPLRGADGEYRWFLSRAKPVYDAKGRLMSWFGTNTDITNQRDQAAAIEKLLTEVNHRVKNTLATIQVLARRSAPGNDDFVKRFVRRIEALTINQDLLIDRRWGEVPVGELVDAQLGFVRGRVGDRLRCDGPDLLLSARSAETLGLALHELATNALKHGALTDEAGEVRVAWEVKDGNFTMRWNEAGGPPVTTPDFKGFGSAVIRDVPAATFGGEAVLDYTPEGLCWRLTCPLDAVAAH
ncbi:sensor histidine kinase [Croceicoccus sp. YJ47]|uniref:sensor histidine kinase n=1 Tax=Croceicoccus sp. YJ47 TaxID=2798724 RepID=UPI001F16EA1D|nr:PAS domain S-box protein [Croceicoccus sp. YJ47]